MSEEIIVQNWERINGFKIPYRIQKVATENRKLTDKCGFGQLYELASFAMMQNGSSSMSRFENEELGIGTFSFSLQDFTYCGRSTITSLLQVANFNEEILEARLIANQRFEGTPRHRDSIHYIVKELDKDFARGEIYRLGFPANKLCEFKASLN